MKFKILFLFILFSISLSAKKAPKWKDGNFKTTSSGLQYKIVKEGKGDSIRVNDSVVVEYVLYSGPKVIKKYNNKKLEQGNLCFALGKNLIGDGFKESAMLLKVCGSGYFIVPQKDSSRFFAFYFIRVVKVIRNYFSPLPIINPPVDSIHFTITDPNKKYFGDTLFSLMKLVELPQLVNCGSSKIVIAFKFEMIVIEDGVQHKNILIFIECPENYGKDYFAANANYMVTCVPLLDDLKSGSRTMNAYALEKLDKYYGLRIRKM